MLFAGVLAVRRISEMGATFKLTARIQVPWNRLSFVLLHAYVSLVFQLLLTALSMLVTAASVRSLQAKQGLPGLNQAVGWTIFGALFAIQDVSFPM